MLKLHDHSVCGQATEKGEFISSIARAVCPCLDKVCPMGAHSSTQELSVGQWAQETYMLEKRDCGVWRSAAVE